MSNGLAMAISNCQWTDQMTDAKLIEEIWGVGLRPKEDEFGVVRKEELLFCLKELMEGQRGDEIRKNAGKLKELAKKAVDQGGSSDKTTDEFVRRLKFGS